MHDWSLPGLMAFLAAVVLMVVVTMQMRAARVAAGRRRNQVLEEVHLTRKELDPEILARIATAGMSDSTIIRAADRLIAAGAAPLSAAQSGDWRFRTMGRLLSHPKRCFLETLEQIVAGRCRIAVEVHLGGLLQPIEPLEPTVWARHRTLLHRHVDYVLCTEDYRIIGVIQLDEAAHGGYTHAENDRIVDSALRSAGIPVLRLHSKQLGNRSWLEQAMEHEFHLE